MTHPRAIRPLSLLTLAALIGAVVLLPACGSSAPARARSVTPNVSSNVPTALRGTLQTVARLSGVTPSRVSGIGFVVGLDGTGGLPLNEEVAASLERMMLLRGVGQTGAYEGTRLEGKTPRQLLTDRNTAAVIVEAAVPPGAMAGDSIDVYVRALNATSLEGGRLWSSDLHIGPPTVIGQRQSRSIAKAEGPIFINPFADPDVANVGVSQTIGRILGGGTMTDDLRIEIILNRVSHAQARLITGAINSAFPAGPLDDGPIARGRNDRIVFAHVPRRYADKRTEFTQLLRHIVLDRSYPELYARRFANALKSTPAAADGFAWALEALGEPALPFVRELYDFAEPAPRLRALRTGAHLGDPLAADPLIFIAKEGPLELRSQAIRLLEDIDAGPKVDFALRDLLEDPQITVRIAAYETLTERGVRRRYQQLEAYDRNRPGGVQARLSLSSIDTLSRMRVPEGTILGVSRELAAGKFFLDRVPAGRGLIYITQQDEPRLALFGRDVGFKSSFAAGVWSDRFMLVRDEVNGPIRLYYRERESARPITLEDVPDTLAEFIKLLVHKPTPESPAPGLDLSYSEVIGVLYELNKQKVINAAFTTERDRLEADLRQAATDSQVQLRPETPEDQEPVIIRGYEEPGEELTPEPNKPTESLLVPLGPEKADKPEDQSP
ncbi:MAG: flagellar basal body P-ring protein FlgI [Phycisphaerales bacterium]